MKILILRAMLLLKRWLAHIILGRPADWPKIALGYWENYRYS